MGTPALVLAIVTAELVSELLQYISWSCLTLLRNANFNPKNRKTYIEICNTNPEKQSHDKLFLKRLDAMAWNQSIRMVENRPPTVIGHWGTRIDRIFHLFRFFWPTEFYLREENSREKAPSFIIWMNVFCFHSLFPTALMMAGAWTPISPPLPAGWSNVTPEWLIVCQILKDVGLRQAA